MSELIARAWIGRQHSLSETAIRKHAKANGWTRDLSGAVRSRVRESLVREGVRANLLAGVTPSEAAIVDAAARGVEWCACTGATSMHCQAAAGLPFSRFRFRGRT